MLVTQHPPLRKAQESGCSPGQANARYLQLSQVNLKGGIHQSNPSVVHYSSKLIPTVGHLKFVRGILTQAYQAEAGHSEMVNQAAARTQVWRYTPSPSVTET
jgi:hypothetical protein